MGILFSSKKEPIKCAICHKIIENKSEIEDLCVDCFNYSCYLSKVLNYLQNTTVSNLNIIQSADKLHIPNNIDFSIDTFARDDEKKIEYQGVEIFSPPEEKSVSTAMLIHERTNSKYILDKDVIKIGRSADTADIVLEGNRTLGRCHAVIKREKGIYVLSDCDSVNGTIHNEKQLVGNENIQLSDGDILMLSNEKFVFIIE